MTVARQELADLLGLSSARIGQLVAEKAGTGSPWALFVSGVHSRIYTPERLFIPDQLLKPCYHAPGVYNKQRGCLFQAYA